MQAGLYLTAARGLGTPEARICYERAEPLCYSLNRPLLLHVAFVGRWRYSLITDKLSATMQIAKRVHALATKQKESALIVGAYRALAATLYFLGDFETARQYAMRGLLIWHSGGGQSPVEEPITPAVSCLCYQALSDWHFGKVASCQAAMEGAISLANELNEAHALGQALWFAGFVVGHFEHNPAEVERLASDLIELSTCQSFAFWLAGGEVLRGWARSASGDTTEGILWIEDGIRDYRATASVLDMLYLLALKAEALHLADRTSQALEAIRRQMHSSKDMNSAGGLPNCSACAVFFSRLSVLTNPKLRLHSAQPSELQRSRSRFRWRSVQKRPTQNIAGKK
jgi:hypothetical protein